MTPLAAYLSMPAFKRLGLLALVLVAVLLPRIVYANAAPPPADLRFDFIYETSEPVTLEGVQLVACTGEACSEPILVGAYGRCDVAPCLPATFPTEEQTGRPLVPIECTRDGCHYDGEDRYHYQYRLVLQFSDGVRESRIFPASFEPYRVRVQDEGVVVGSLVSEAYGGVFVIFSFLPILLFVWVIEAIVAYLFLRYRRIEVRRVLLWLLVLHLATLPIVWSFFPALSWAPTVEARSFAPAALGLVLLLAGVAILHARGRLSRWVALGALLLGLVGVPLLAYLGGRGILTPPLLDLSPTVTTVLSEVFVFAFEAWFLYTISRGRLPLAQAALLSLLANVASYGGGQLFIRTLQSL